MNRDAIHEHFFTALISGNRMAARNIINMLHESDCPAERIISGLFWPTLTQIQTMYRNDQLSQISYQLATRLFRMLVDQLQLSYYQHDRRHVRVMVCCGPEESEEMSAQIVADMLEADGYDVFYIGGGVANDEIIEQISDMHIDRLVVFGVVPSTVPFTRLLIDRFQAIGATPHLQVIVGGGVFNRAEGLAEEIGADLWGHTPEDIVKVMSEMPERRMTEDQRTVGRKRRDQAA